MKIYLEQLENADAVTLVGDRGASVRIVKTHGDEPATATATIPPGVGIRAIGEADSLLYHAVGLMSLSRYSWWTGNVKNDPCYIEAPPVFPSTPPDPDLGAALEREADGSISES